MEADEHGWTRVKSRKEKYRNSRVVPIRKYWNGFDLHNKERWYIELNDGKIISSQDKDFNYWNIRL